MKVSVVVPCYRSAATLPELVKRLEPALQQLVDSSRIQDWEVVLVVDGTGDDTGEVARSLSLAHGRMTTIELRRNFGQHNALIAGIREARHDVIVTLDDDLQHPPEQIYKLLDELRDDVDLVYGIPEVEEHGAVRSAASRLVKASLAAAGVPNARWVGAFRAFRTDVREVFAAVNDPEPNLDVLLSWATSAVRPATVEFARREGGRSGYSLPKLVRHAMNMVTGYGVLPLRLATWGGFVFGLVGLALLVYVVVAYLVGVTTVPGFTTMIAVVAMFSGVQLVSIGIIGEYLGRQHFRTMNKPTYLVRRTTGPREVPVGDEN